MGIFKSGQTDYIQSALESYLQKVRNEAKNKVEYAKWCSWGRSAYAVYASMRTIKGCYIPPNNLSKAKILLELGIQPMITIWYYNLESQISCSDEVKQAERIVALTIVQHFLGIDSDSSIKLYLGFDKELMCFLNDECESTALYAAMFYQRYWECIAGGNIVDWGKLRFPIESDSDLRNACHEGKYKLVGSPNESVENTIALGVAIVDAGCFMFGEFKRRLKIGRAYSRNSTQEWDETNKYSDKILTR
jgi:hypothetical protein